MGRPRKQIDEDQLFELAKIHCTMEEMAAVMDCHVQTLRERFSHVIEKGREQGKMSLRRAQFKMALNGNCQMAIFLGKQYLGQSDKVVHDGPQQPISVFLHGDGWVKQLDGSEAGPAPEGGGLGPIQDDPSRSPLS